MAKTERAAKILDLGGNPSPAEEIVERAEAIRETWTDDERELRSVVPLFIIHELRIPRRGRVVLVS